MANRTPLELEQDIAAIDQTLSTVSEIRSSLHYFTRLIQAEKKEPQYVQNFSIRLNAIKRELNKLSIESEGLRGPLEYAQQLSGAGNFSWPMIKEAASKEAGDEDIADENNSDKQKEAGAMIKEKAESVLGQLSSVVLDRAQTQKPNRFITSHIQYWMLNDKPTNLGMIVEIDEEEKETLVGSTCHIKVTVQKVLVASLSLEYESKSNTLILQQFDIRGPREEKSAWQESDHFVFQKINMLAKDAFGDMTTLSAKEALSSILQWLASYHNLFVEPCYRCHKRLQFDSPHYKHLPAVVRTWVQRRPEKEAEERWMVYRTIGLAYHMRCFMETTEMAE